MILYKKETIMNKYLVLLRGINVGGNNIIKMDELKKLFEEAGFTGVLTYIQSGNIIFNDLEKNKLTLTEKIENILYKKMGNKITVSILTFSEIKKVINKKPEVFGEEKEKFKYDVIFLIEPLKTKEAVKEIKSREGVDEMYEGEKVIYKEANRKIK
jgi:uncharacterized protein (DUF1697 family)